MTALFCLVGTIDADHIGRTVWPVCFRVERADAEHAKKVCEEQRDKFIAELEPVVLEIRAIKRRRPTSTRTYNERRTGRGLSREAQRRAEEKWSRDHRIARDREAAINAKYAIDMLDPLFPTSTNGSMPNEVVYKILEFWDDPREMGVAALMVLRAQLHGGFTDDDDTETEDFT